MSIKDCGVDEQEFLQSWMLSRSRLFRPVHHGLSRYPLVSEIKEIYRKAYGEEINSPVHWPHLFKARRIHGFSGLFPLSASSVPRPTAVFSTAGLAALRGVPPYGTAPLTENTLPDSGDSFLPVPGTPLLHAGNGIFPPSPSKPAVWRKWRIPMPN